MKMSEKLKAPYRDWKSLVNNDPDCTREEGFTEIVKRYDLDREERTALFKTINGPTSLDPSVL